LKGIPREIYEHNIELMGNTQHIKHKQYIMNPNYTLKVRKNLDKLLDVGFIYLIETTPQLSPLVIVRKKMVNYIYPWITEN